MGSSSAVSRVRQAWSGLSGFWRTIVIVVASLAAVSAVITAVAALLLFLAFRSNDPDVRSCDGGFKKSEWRQDRKAVGRAIGKCDWLEGWTTAQMYAALGNPDYAPYQRYYTWDLGAADQGIGPMNWFLIIRVRDGRVMSMDAEARNT